MRIKIGDDINSAIKKVCEDSTRAGSIVVLIQREYPDMALSYLKAMDSKGLYGSKIADWFFKDCGSNIDIFLKRLTDGI